MRWFIKCISITFALCYPEQMWWCSLYKRWDSLSGKGFSGFVCIPKWISFVQLSFIHSFFFFLQLNWKSIHLSIQPSVGRKVITIRPNSKLTSLSLRSVRSISTSSHTHTHTHTSISSNFHFQDRPNKVCCCPFPDFVCVCEVSPFLPRKMPTQFGLNS